MTTIQTMSLDTHAVTQLAIAAWSADIEGDHEATAEALHQIGDLHQERGMFGACQVWANITVAAFRKKADLPEDAEVIGFLPPANANPYMLFAHRFIVACAQKDLTQAAHLFNATLTHDRDHHQECVIALLTMATALSGSIIDSAE